MDRIKMGNYLTELRKEKDLSQTDLAEIIGVTFQAVSKWERGEAIPDITILEKLARFYHISIDEIIKGEGNSLKANDDIDRVEVKNEKHKEKGFLKQKRIFGFWFSIAYFLLFFIIAFCPFAAGKYSVMGGYAVISANYYQIIFSPNYNIGNFLLLIQFLTTLSIVTLSLLFYVCTTKSGFKALYLTRFILIIFNSLTLIVNCILFIADAAVGAYLMFILILVADILYLALKPNRKSYILQDYQ